MTKPKITSRILADLARANDPRIGKLLGRIEKLTAAAAQKAQRERADNRKARDAAVFVIGGALLAMIEANDAAAIAIARNIAAQAARQQDIDRLQVAIDRGVIPPVLRPRKTLSVPVKPSATPAASAPAN